MKINIEINCETFYEMFAHMEVIKHQMYQNIDPYEMGEGLSDDLDNMEFYDSNCYGDHSVVIEFQEKGAKLSVTPWAIQHTEDHSLFLNGTQWVKISEADLFSDKQREQIDNIGTMDGRWVNVLEESKLI